MAAGRRAPRRASGRPSRSSEPIPDVARTRIPDRLAHRCRCCRRCSSSPAPAPAAARRRTCGCSPSCSATASSSPTPPAARRSTAATCRRRPTRPTPTAAARRGPTRCSRTTPSSGSACGSALDAARSRARLLLDALAAEPARRARRRRCAAPCDRRRRALAARREQPSPSSRALPRRRSTHAEAPRARPAGRHARPALRVDRRRRRLGLRHRLRRPRPRARLAPQRERAGARHRGLLEHRRPAVEGHAARARSPSSRPPARRPRKKDLGLLAMSYGHVYVASVAMQARSHQTVKALPEAERHPGPSLVIAHSPCIAHGYDLVHSPASSAVRSTAAPGRSTASIRGASRPASRRCTSTPTRSRCRCRDYMREEARFRMVELPRPRPLRAPGRTRPSGRVAEPPRALRAARPDPPARPEAEDSDG